MTPEKFRPINGRLLLRKCDPIAESRGGLFMPGVDSGRNISEILADVVAAAVLDTKGHELTVKAGDRVLIRGIHAQGNSIGTLFGREHEGHFVVTEEEILGIVEKGSGVRFGEYGEYEA